MSETIEQALKRGQKMCIEYGYTFIDIYQVKNEILVNDGWDRFIAANIRMTDEHYDYIGFVRGDGSYELPYYRTAAAAIGA
jgi:hypothetical protein